MSAQPTKTDPPVDQLIDVQCDLEAIVDIMHGLGTAAVNGDFIIEGCGVKFLATQLAVVKDRIGEIREVMMEREPG